MFGRVLLLIFPPVGRKLHISHVLIDAVGFSEFFGRTLFGNLSVLEDNYFINAVNGSHSVSDDKNCLVADKL